MRLERVQVFSRLPALALALAAMAGCASPGPDVTCEVPEGRFHLELRLVAGDGDQCPAADVLTVDANRLKVNTTDGRRCWWEHVPACGSLTISHGCSGGDSPLASDWELAGVLGFDGEHLAGELVQTFTERSGAQRCIATYAVESFDAMR